MRQAMPCCRFERRQWLLCKHFLRNNNCALQLTTLQRVFFFLEGLLVLFTSLDYEELFMPFLHAGPPVMK